MTAKNWIVAMVVLCAVMLLAGVATAQEPAGRSVVLDWNIPTERENGEALPVEEIGGYEIRYSVDGGEPESLVVPDGTATGYQLDGLSGGSYQFTISAYDTDGLYSEFVSVEARVITAGPRAVGGAKATVIPLPDPADVCAESPACRVDVLSARYGQPNDN